MALAASDVGEGIRSVPSIRCVLDLPAALVICRYADGEGMIIINPEVPVKQLRSLCRVLCTAEERQAVEDFLAD